MRGKRSLTLGVVLGMLGLPSAAGAAGTGTLDSIPLPGPASHVVAAPDGSLFVTLWTRRTVARVTPDGTVTETADLGGQTAGITVAAGKVWAAVPALKKVVSIDPADLTSITTVDTPPGSCGPVGLADGGNGSVYASLPTGSLGCGLPSALLAISTTGVAGPAILGRGTAYDLLVSGGFLWVPDYADDKLRRVALDAGLTTQATFDAPAGSAPNGIAAGPNADIVVSLNTSGGLARTPATASPGSLATFGPSIQAPFGVATIGGSLFAASSSGTPQLFRFPADGSLAPPAVLQAGSEPWDIAGGPDGTVIVTDRQTERLLRFTSRPPRAGTSGASNLNTGSARVASVVNPGGNVALTTVQFGTTTAYGSTAVATPAGFPLPPAASGTADVPLSATLDGLQPNTTYHYRAVAVTGEGTAYGEDRTFTTLAPTGQARPGEGKAAVKVAFSSSLKKGVGRVSRIRVSGLSGGEKITVTCSGKGCPAKKKDRTVKVTVKKAGTLTVKAGKITKAKLAKGASIKVDVAKTGAVGVVSTIKRGSKRFTTKTLCRQPGAKKAGAC